MSNKLVDKCVVARLYGVTEQTVLTWVQQGRIPCVRPTKRTLRFNLNEVERALTKPAESQKMEAKT